MLPRLFGLCCRWALFSLAIALLLNAPSAKTAAPLLSNLPPPADKILIMDGSFVHDVGRLQCNITNWGLIGSHPTISATYSHAPSCRWPAVGSPDYLWAGSLWVGARFEGQPAVSTGQYRREFRPSDDPRDTIYRTAKGAAGGHRYPEPLPDDDGDGAEDEDPLNGWDDDGDGLVDEDFAAIGEQHFVCQYDDITSLPFITDHVPVGIDVRQETFQWSDPRLRDAIGIAFTIENTGLLPLEDVYIGFFADCDVGMRTDPLCGQDDMARYWEGTAAALNGLDYPVRVAYMYDDNGDFGMTPGFLGVALLDHTTDPTGATAPTAVAVRSFQVFNGMLSYNDGGDPANDSERYDAMSADVHDPDVPPGYSGDYRILISSGPFPSVAPGQEIHYEIALVIGEADMFGVAAEMARLYEGAAFDRDGDPATGPDGRECRVPWLRPQDVPTPATWGRLRARGDVGGLRLEWETNLADAEDLALVRRAGAGASVSERRWTAGEIDELRPGAEGMGGSLLDAEPAAWPRTYQLWQGAAGGASPGAAQPGAGTLLAEVSLAGPPAAPLRLSVWPNPANPRVVLRFGLPEGGRARLTVHDVRGRLVRSLLDAERPAGEAEATWDGLDDRGRPAPSGAYEARLRCGTRQVNRAVTLVR